MKRHTLVLMAASLLTGCETPPPTAPAQTVPGPAPAPLVAPVQIEPPPAPAPPPVAVQPSGPVTAAAQQQAQKVAVATADLLQSGNEDQARTELKHALNLDPQNKLALSLTKQMAVDPVAMLPHDPFSYTVKPGDTLALIAQRYLGDPYLFYILARYNEIKVPRLLSSGQVIQVPGKASAPAVNPPSPSPVSRPSPQRLSPAPPAASPPPAPAPPAAAAPSPPAAPTVPAPLSPGEQEMRDGATAEQAGDLPRALAAYRKADNLKQSGASARVEKVRGQLVSRYSTSARNALARQDLDGAIGNWQRVLELDPGHSAARFELERVRGLKEKLKNVN